MAENVMADNTSMSTLILPEGCRANNIFGVISEPMDVENSPERNFGAIKASLMSNTADEIVVKVESDIFCGLEKLPMCVALYKEDGPHIFALSDGAATIPVSALSDSKTRSVAQTVAIGIGFDKNLLLPGISDGYSLATVCVHPKESSGIEGIEADSQDEAEFYNLQGVRMDKGALVPGVYIRVQNGIARKTAVK
ncbi:MAG: hypothetical protein K2F79_00200 [Muribaculaceae bacterium]|nr:hypothetical protein [Muribaculaceae bacterium]